MHLPKQMLFGSFGALCLLELATAASSHRAPVCNSTRIYGGSFGSLRQPYYPPAADCRDYMIPVDITYDNYVINASQWDDNHGLTDFLSTVTTRAGAEYPAPLNGPIPTNGTYQIAASFCTPKWETNKAKNVIIATHGIGPARAHWNSPYEPEDYNFVQYAINQGYSVFFYDRLGCGASEK